MAYEHFRCCRRTYCRYCWHIPPFAADVEWRLETVALVLGAYFAVAIAPGALVIAAVVNGKKAAGRWNWPPFLI